MNLIKQFRKKHKLSQRALAELLGVNIRSVQRWETGERNPSKQTLKMLELLDKKDST